MNELFPVIYEDAELLVINKPAGLVCHPTKGDEFSSLIGRVRMYLAKASVGAGGGGRPGAHIINRLDRETSGVVLVAKTAEAAGELGRIWETRSVEKEYGAIVHGAVRETQGVIEAPLGKDEQSRVAIKDCVRADGAAARTEYWLTRRICGSGPGGKSFSFLRVVPRTGRKHQIRIHLAHIGHPIVGDKLYGGDEDLYMALVENRLTEEQRGRLMVPNHALCAKEVRFAWRGQQRRFAVEPDVWLQQLEQRITSSAGPLWR
jgi:23S rRNA pseudouridine1911/1915/1917 synthase